MADNNSLNYRDEQSLSTPLIVPASFPLETPISNSKRCKMEPIDPNDSPNGPPSGAPNGPTMGSTNPSDTMANPLSPPYEVLESQNMGQNYPMGGMSMGLVGSEPTRSRGRPRGSKNRPRDMVMDSDKGLPCKAHVLEIPNGIDIVEVIRHFAQAQKAGVTIHCGVGRVKNVTVRSPPGAQESNTFYTGTFDIIMINGVHVGPAISKTIEKHCGPYSGSYSYFTGAHNNIAVMLSGPRLGFWAGQILGPLVTATTVLLHVSTFGCYEFHRLIPDQAHYPSTSGAGPSSGGPNPSPNSASGSGANMGDGLSKDPNSTGRKRNCYSDN